MADARTRAGWCVAAKPERAEHLGGRTTTEPESGEEDSSDHLAAFFFTCFL